MSLFNTIDCTFNNKRVKRKRSDGDIVIEDRLVVYISDDKLLNETTKVPLIRKRNLITDNLIESYNLKLYMTVCPSIPTDEDDLKMFHATDYIEHLKIERDCDDSLTENDSEFGLGYDCPLLKDALTFACTIAGGTVTAADKLINHEADVAINWSGGWHHAQRDEAEGFCYVNDIVLGIQHLLKKFYHVLYIDLDVHHGNGVENAFAYTRKVLTLSFHQYEVGFYPCSGSIEDVGSGNAKHYTVNVPLKEGLSDSNFTSIFNRIANAVNSIYKPEAVVVQCGADGLASDPIGQFNLTHEGYGNCVRTILKWKKPTLFLGGGGYNIKNTARCWTYLTSIIVNKTLDVDISDECLYFNIFGPDFELNVTPSNRKDTNTSDYINEVVSTVLCNLNNIKEDCE